MTFGGTASAEPVAGGAASGVGEAATDAARMHAMRALCAEFETLLVKEIVKAMGVFAEEEEGQYAAMGGVDLQSELARLLVKDGMLGIADSLFRQMNG